MADRQLPPDLVSALRHARYLEHLAVGQHRERFAVHATGALMLAAVRAGWRQKDIAALLGLKRQTVQKRIERTRARFDNERPALVIDVPLGRPPRPVAVLRQPIEQRTWLTAAEAAAHAGVSQPTIRNWHRRGILPNTDIRAGSLHLYFQPDLDRVGHGPRRGPYPDYAALLEEIAAAPL